MKLNNARRAALHEALEQYTQNTEESLEVYGGSEEEWAKLTAAREMMEELDRQLIALAG